MRNSSML